MIRPLRTWIFPLLACLGFMTVSAEHSRAEPPARSRSWDWAEATPDRHGMSAEKLETAWKSLTERRTSALLVVRGDRVVFERYAPGLGRNSPHYTASLAKALVGGVSLVLALGDGRIQADDLAGRHVSQWRDDPERRGITIRHLATHTSGIEDAHVDGVPHDQLPGWKGDFWKRLPPPVDPFSLARDRAPALEPPGTRERYSNPGIAMLSYCLTASLKGTKHADLRTLLRRRVMEPLGVPAAEWSIGYGTVTTVEGLPLVAAWGGGSYSPDAVARVGRLLLHQGRWDDRPLLDRDALRTALDRTGAPSHSALGFWVNTPLEGERLWRSAPIDAFGGAGAGHQFLLVVPSLDLIVVRFGDALDPSLSFHEALDRHVIAPITAAVSPLDEAPYPPSPVIRDVRWAPVASIVRKARDSDNWPLTWGDDDAQYTAYGDGRGFDPPVSRKLSLGFAKVVGPPDAFEGINIPSATGERLGDGARGEKASGIVMVDGILYLWVRNADVARLARSSDHAATWEWSDWRFEKRFGCPTFLNFGKNLAGSRDDYVYVYSPDSESAYEASDRLLLARVPRDQIMARDAYEFFQALDERGAPKWSRDVEESEGVFRNPGRCYRTSVSYDAGLGRYLLCQAEPGENTRFRGGFGVYDAPAPWGPWTTTYFTRDWDVGPGESCGFPTKWMSADGKTVHMVFSGADSFSVRKAEFLVAE